MQLLQHWSKFTGSARQPALEAMTEQEADAYLAMLCASMLLPLLDDSEDG